MSYFTYGAAEVAHLKRKDARLGEAIDMIGPIKRSVDPDLFSALVVSIIGQQISTKAQATIAGRMRADLGAITPSAVHNLSAQQVQQYGVSHRKASYIKQIAAQVATGAFNLNALYDMQDMQVAHALSSLHGVGGWTAEMLLLFSMQRPNILSFGDLAIQRGMRMLYHHRRITPELFETYRRRYAPYASVASLYLWEIAGGAIPGMKDYAPAKKKPAPKKRLQSGGAQK